MLFDTVPADILLASPPAGFTLWFRRDGRGGAWEAVATAPTEGECVRAIGVGGRRGGKWLILPTHKQP